MSVELHPSGLLGFHRPLTQLVKVTLSVANNNHQPVMFKVKTTAPKSFCVRPNSGRIEPGERVEVQVLLQPMKEEPAPGTKCKDKFLVQSALITPDRETKSLQELWATVEAEHKSGKEGVIHEQKIRCAFLPLIDSEGASTPTNYAAGAAAGNDSSFIGGTSSGFTDSNNSTVMGTPSASRFDTVKSQGTPYHAAADRSLTSANGEESAATNTDSSPAPAYSPPQQDTTDLAGKDNSSTSTSTGIVAGAQNAASNLAASLPRSTEEAKAVASNAATSVSNAATNAAASVGLTSGTTASTTSVGAGGDSKLSLELQAAKKEIDRLKDIIAQKEKEASAGLRQRNVGSSSESSSLGAQTQTAFASASQEGVPIQMVAAIAAGVFFFTWLFF